MSTDRPSTQSPRQGGVPRRATVLQVMAAVLGSFLGIRRGSAMQRDAVSIKPIQVIIAGVIAAAIFVATLLLIVRFVIHHA